MSAIPDDSERNMRHPDFKYPRTNQDDDVDDDMLSGNIQSRSIGVSSNYIGGTDARVLDRDAIKNVSKLIVLMNKERRHRDNNKL